MIALPNIILYRHNKHGVRFSVPKSKILFYDLTLVISGHFTYIIDNVKHEIKTGDAILIRPGSFRERLLSPFPVNYVSFNFTINEFQEKSISPTDDENGYSLESYLNLPIHIGGIINNDIKMLIDVIDVINSKNMFPNFKSITFSLLNILHLIKQEAEKSDKHPTVETIINFLANNYKEKISVSDIQKLTFFSAAHCHSLFKKETGMTIIDYLNEYRINKAKNLLIEGTMSLDDISNKTGFTSYNYFSRMFKNKTGYSPKDFQKIALIK